MRRIKPRHFTHGSYGRPRTTQDRKPTSPPFTLAADHEVGLGVRRFTVQGKNTGFTCVHCGCEVPPLRNGSCRNHCPFCLRSLHVDINPGDRASRCGGVLEPVGVDYSGKKGWIIVSRCVHCGETKRNRAALDDPAAPDDYDLLVALSRRPL